MELVQGWRLSAPDIWNSARNEERKRKNWNRQAPGRRSVSQSRKESRDVKRVGVSERAAGARKADAEPAEKARD